ncbi:ankyrin repeat protein [Megavirus baoshan]|uniref:Ankyrin repeat protein n=1 Tax=Megavirus baoshan TaxID=2496520 RepID=A0A3S5HLF4_9VIRU|nr:ankyrin repeat protein [Megavirus baoshan]AZL89834.1 ankyrin repeat protein [Megavirus baoshan]
MDIIESYDFNKKYNYCHSGKCRNFTKLMWLIIHEKKLSNKHDKIISFSDNNKISFGHHKIIQHLKKKKNLKKINNTNKHGWTALMMASIISNNYQTVELLIKLGADINKQNRYGYTALMLACIHSRTTNSNKTIQLLLDYGSDIDKQNTYGMTALMCSIYAINSNGLDIVKLLLKYGANIGAKTNNGLTLLMLLCINIIEINNDETIEYIIDQCPNINSISNEGCTALMYACRLINKKSTVKTFESLLKHGACPNITNNGMTVLRKILQMNQNDDLVKLLLQYNADPNIITNNINDLFFLAKYIKSGNKLKLLLLLLDYGADYKMVDKNGRTFIDFINDDEKIACTNKIEAISSIKNNMNIILKSIPDVVTEYIYSINSFSIQLLNLKWSINKYNSKDELPEYYLRYYHYFNAVDFNDFIYKVHDAIKYMY